MSLLRQSGSYLLVGLLQLLLDWGVFVGASAVGVDAIPANLCGRICGAMLGFWLNGRVTFAQDGQARLGWQRFGRFSLMWLVATVLSTWLLALVESHFGLRHAWLAKPVVEGGLAIATFFAGRHLVYR